MRRASEAPSALRERGWDRKVWDEADSTRELARCVHEIYHKEELREKVMAAAKGEGDGLQFDKDDQIAMNFVAAASNLRSRVFQIPVQSSYEAKGVAGNIIPAIATTNAIIAGLQVMEALKILKGGVAIGEACRYTYCLREPTRKGLYLLPTPLEKPAKSCFVCNTSTLELCLDTETLTLADLVERVLKQRLGVNEPTVGLGATTLYEEGDGADDRLVVNLTKLLKDLPGGGIKDDTAVEVEDFSQDLTVKLNIFHKTFDEEEERGRQGRVTDGDRNQSPLIHVKQVTDWPVVLGEGA
ncbi:putative ubiquitin activating enzyme [Ectocarpus siliculosus]|uniref:Ubiquitin activating enzyme n=1 Tax=Ectocarpus siliculosus TaxID=2880 RepID=D7FHM8_ECTSI|nr:putative ubiquitin activating enzyme [Ectocarpus siliculosus]|eukprot:CBJ28585.1 putative ubiquitin activating enzyme [Ectocarpus siliculosus]